MFRAMHDRIERSRAVPSWAYIEGLAQRVGAGETTAWAELMAALEPKLQVLVRYQRIGRLRSREDDLRNVVVAVFEKLRRRDHHVLRTYAAMPGRPSFEAWIRRVVRSVAIDYLRGHDEYRRGDDAAAGSGDRWVSLHALTGSGLAMAPASAEAKRREVMLALAATVAAADEVKRGGDADAVASQLGVAPLHVRRAAERGARMQAVVELLFQGHRHGSIADALGLTRREVEIALEHVEELLVARLNPDGVPDDREPGSD
jgi:DNA-directed RNA polymerase specialized sigma24 family protein